MIKKFDEWLNEQKQIDESLHRVTKNDLSNLVERANKRMNVSYNGKNESGKFTYTVEGSEYECNSKAEAYKEIKEMYKKTYESQKEQEKKMKELDEMKSKTYENKKPGEEEEGGDDPDKEKDDKNKSSKKKKEEED